MPKPKLVTIVTPSLNQGRFIAHAIRSVASQTYTPIEHVVVDGGSTDGTLEIVRRHESDYFRWSSEPDTGMYNAINRGLVLARGEILAYLNTDDAYLPWTVERAVAALDARPDVDLVYGDGVRIDQETGAQSLRLFPPFDASALAARDSLMQPSVFWRRRLYERIGGFDDRMRYVADLDYWLRGTESGKVAHVDDVLSVERVHAGSLSEKASEAMAIEEVAMRRSRGADLGTPDGQRQLARATERDRIWRRRLWLRFLGARLRGGRDRPWRRFLDEGHVQVSIPRILAGQLPRCADRFLPDAVTSNLAVEALGLKP